MCSVHNFPSFQTFHVDECERRTRKPLKRKKIALGCNLISGRFCEIYTLHIKNSRSTSNKNAVNSAHSVVRPLRSCHSLCFAIYSPLKIARSRLRHSMALRSLFPSSVCVCVCVGIIFGSFGDCSSGTSNRI